MDRSFYVDSAGTGFPRLLRIRWNRKADRCFPGLSRSTDAAGSERGWSPVV